MNFWKTLRKTTGTVRTRKCVLPARQRSLLVGVPSRRRLRSGKRDFQAASLNPSANSAGSKGPLLEMTGRETTETTLENATAGVLFAGRTGAVTGSVKRRGAITRWTDGKVIRRPREIIQSIEVEPAHPDGRWMLETKANPTIKDCEFSAQRADGSAWTQPVLYCQINDILEKVHCGSGLCTFQG